MSSHVNETHAAAATLGKVDQVEKSFLEDMVVSEDEKKAGGKLFEKALERQGGCRQNKSMVVLGRNKGKGKKGSKGKGLEPTVPPPVN